MVETLLAVGSVVSALSSISQGRAQSAMFKAQAADVVTRAKSQSLEFRRKALNHKREGVAVLRAVQRNLATINAMAGLATLDPSQGSIGNLMDVNFSEGIEDFKLAVDDAETEMLNAQITTQQAAVQAQLLRNAGKQAQTQGYMGALTSVAGAGMKAYDAGMFSSAAPAPQPNFYGLSYGPAPPYANNLGY